MILAFVAGALVFALGVMIGASITQTNLNRIMNYKDNEKGDS
jgi:hypothetical protein